MAQGSISLTHSVAQSRGGNCGGKDNKHVHSMLRADNEHEECTATKTLLLNDTINAVQTD